jgi:hypothetical protein
MTTQYDVTLRRDPTEAFGNAVNDRAPYGGREVIDAAANCLIIAMLQDLQRFLPPDMAAAITDAFAQQINHAIEVATALHTAPRKGSVS